MPMWNADPAPKGREAWGGPNVISVLPIGERQAETDRANGKHVDDGYSQIVQQIPMKELKDFTLNIAFVRRSARLMYWGIGSPLQSGNKLMYFILAINLASQILGAWMLQNNLYILATGRDNSYPGLAGCLKNGCGGLAPNGKVWPAPGRQEFVADYIRTFIWFFFVAMALLLIMSFTGDAINALMRRNLALMFHRRLLQNDKLLYRLTVDGTMDNVDQRITSDLQVTLDGFCCVLFGNSADYLAYPTAFMLTRFGCSLANCFGLPDTNNDTKRGRIIGVIIAAVSVAILAYILPVNHVAKIFFRGQRYEGDFRTSHTRAVLNAEQISTLRGELAEKELAQRQFDRVDNNNKLYYMWQGVLLILRLLVTISIPACAYVCLAITEMTNSTTANFFQKQIGDVFEYVLYFPVYIERLAFACGAMHRVGQLLEEMTLFENTPVKSSVEFDSQRIALKDVTANPPVPLKGTSKNNIFGGGMGGRALFEHVSLCVKRGESMCILGPSGCGKSSLLRVIAGLWGVDDGVVVKPSVVGRGGVFFLPQKPYVFPGNLLQQVLYPAVLDDAMDLRKVLDCLRVVHLGHLEEKYGLEKSINWSTALSFSEMQRLNFARMFYHSPAFCLADECTSALDLRLESFLYTECSNRNISMISIAHRPSVIPHHTFVFKYTAATHSWSQVAAESEATEGKFPTHGLELVSGEGDQLVEETEECDEGLNLRFVKRFFRLIRLSLGKAPYQVFLIWFVQAGAMAIYAGLTVEIFKNYGTSVIIALITGTKPYTPATRDLNLALNKCGIIIGLNSVIAIVQSVSCLVGAWLAVRIQRAVVGHFHAKYFSPGTVYHVNRIMKERGVDQRIVQDLSGLREALAWLFGNPFAYCNYRVGALPLLLVWIILGAYALSTGWQLTIFLGGFMLLSFAWQIVACFATSRQVGARQRWEGDLRLHLGRTLQNIETITFFGGQEQERAIADELMQCVHGRRMGYYAWSNFTSLPTISMYYWLQTGIYVMAAVVAIWWAPGSADVAPSMLFTTINFDIIWSKVVQLIIMCFGGLGMVVGFTHRVMRVLERADTAQGETQAMQSRLKLDDDSVRMLGVSIAVPRSGATATTLVRRLDLTLNESLVAQGRGKSSVLRVLAGMWPHASGQVYRPKFGSGGIMFVPQANYAVHGTLAAQVVYPKRLSEVVVGASDIEGILNEVGLGYITERWGLNRVVNWDVVLSGGECQRLGFARVLFHRPKIAVMDETTSALDLATEQRCMEALLKRNIRLVSFAARPSVANYHSQKLQLTADGGQFVGGS